MLILHALLSPVDFNWLYCNSVLYGVSDTNIAKLQRMENSLALVVCKSPYNTHVTELLHELHWLPVRQIITYKVAAITYHTQNCQRPSYLCNSLISYQPVRTLRSSSSDLLVFPNRVKTVTASRAFRAAALTISRTFCPTLLKLQIRWMFLSVV
jgi:hypothetical protein